MSWTFWVSNWKRKDLDGKSLALSGTWDARSALSEHILSCHILHLWTFRMASLDPSRECQLSTPNLPLSLKNLCFQDWASNSHLSWHGYTTKKWLLEKSFQRRTLFAHPFPSDQKIWLQCQDQGTPCTFQLGASFCLEPFNSKLSLQLPWSPFWRIHLRILRPLKCLPFLYRNSTIDFNMISSALRHYSALLFRNIC